MLIYFYPNQEVLGLFYSCFIPQKRWKGAGPGGPRYPPPSPPPGPCAQAYPDTGEAEWCPKASSRGDAKQPNKQPRRCAGRRARAHRRGEEPPTRSFFVRRSSFPFFSTAHPGPAVCACAPASARVGVVARVVCSVLVPDPPPFDSRLSRRVCQTARATSYRIGGNRESPTQKKTAEGRPLTAVPSKLLSTPLSRRLISTCAPSNFLSLVPCPCIEMSQGVRQRLGGGVCLQAVPQWVGKVVMREVGIFPGNWAVFVPLRKHPMPACTHRALREVAYPSSSQVLTVVAYIQISSPLAKHAVQPASNCWGIPVLKHVLHNDRRVRVKQRP
jgi:hypothetical protein